MDGIINIYKEKGFTSHDVVAKLRGILRQKKIGHTGTLDPDATGVLPVCLGKATKLCDMLTDKDKIYETIMQLGVTTDTQDMSGTVIKENKVTVSIEEIKQAIYSFQGQYQQIPPMYSALKINGRKLYELAREGKEVERQPRSVTIHSIEILEVMEVQNQVRMRVHCSKGTYIRTLCHDIGQILGCGGAMKELIRTRVSNFSIEDSLTLLQVETYFQEEKLEKYMVTIEEMFLNLAKVTVKEDFSILIYNGNKFGPQHTLDGESKEDNQRVRVYDGHGKFIGIYEFNMVEDIFKPVKMFL